MLVDDKQAREKTPRTDAKIKLFSVTYWLLEHKHYDPRRYWATEKRVGWVTNPLEANRYRSKEDADLTGKVLDDDCSSFEHMDCQVEFVHAEFARQLEREIESLSAQVADWRGRLAEQCGKTLTAEAQVAELKKDAERLDFLDSQRKWGDGFAVQYLDSGDCYVRPWRYVLKHQKHCEDIQAYTNIRYAIDAAKESGVSP